MGQSVTPHTELIKSRLFKRAFIALLPMHLHLSPSLLEPPSPC